MALHRALTWTPELGAAVLGHIKPPAGETLTMAARRIGKPHETVRRWVSIGLKQPEGEPIHAWALEVEATLLDDLASLNRGLRSSRDIMVTKLEMMCCSNSRTVCARMCAPWTLYVVPVAKNFW
mgnify:CR=1 FL=1